MSGIPFDGAPDRPSDKFVILGRENVRNALPVTLPGLAMALHHYLLDIRPGQTVLGIDWIAEHIFPLDSREAVRRANRDLMNAGLVILHTQRDERGRFTKRYQVFYNPQPEADRTPSSGSLTRRRKPGGRQKQSFPQVAPDAGNPAAGEPAAGEPADKELKTEDPETEDQRLNLKMASRRARASGTSATWSDQDKISGVRTAIAAVYGDAENEWISDDECLELYEAKAPKNKRVASPEAYMTKIFEDTPDLGTHLAGLGADPETSTDEKTGKTPWTCPRCEGTSAAPSERGVCVWCDAELDGPRGGELNQAILGSVKRGLWTAVGYVADDEWAARVAAHILDGRNAADPVQYVYGAITQDANPKRFTPTPVPAPARVA